MTTKTKAEKATTNGKADQKEIVVPDLSIRRADVSIVGTSPLIVHRWSEKAKQMMLAKQQKKASTGKDVKDPQRDYEESLYRTADGNHGFPAVGFKAALVRAGTYSDLTMTFLRGAFHVPGELVLIDGTPQMREDIVRLQGKTADLRYRGEFTEWSAVVPVDLNERAVSVEQLINLFRIAGFAVGIGEWRPEKNGQYGRFEVVEVNVQ